MTQTKAIREARVAAVYQGGTWYVCMRLTRRGRKTWNAIRSDQFQAGKDGAIQQTIDHRTPRGDA